MNHKSGFVNIIGHPNVGKSTLMNKLVGERLSIITSKAQTTRHRIMGIVNGDNFQIVYSDTPGIIAPNYKLQESMMKFVGTALEDADIFLIVTEVNDKDIDSKTVDAIIKSGKPVIVALNKVDLFNQEIILNEIEKIKNSFKDSKIIPISALHNFNIASVFDTIIEFLPESPPYYPKDELTDRSMRFFVSEIIREKILLQFKQEIPYSVEVVVNEYKEKANITVIDATIYVSRQSQKGIIIGQQAKAVKSLGIAARHDIEEFIGGKVFLTLQVKVNKDWRNDPQQLKNFGYNL